MHASRRIDSTDPYGSWHCRETVTGAALQAAGHSSSRRSEITSERRRRPSRGTGSVRSDSDGKVQGRDVQQLLALVVTRDVFTAFTRQENQRAEISMNDIMGRFRHGAEHGGATSTRVAARLAAALRGAPCVVSGREARGRGNPASTESPAAAHAGAGGGGARATACPPRAPLPPGRGLIT